jgi:hypothetical protein
MLLRDSALDANRLQSKINGQAVLKPLSLTKRKSFRMSHYFDAAPHPAPATGT